MKAPTNIRIRVYSKHHDATRLCFIENRTIKIENFFSLKKFVLQIYIGLTMDIIDIKVHWFFEKVSGKTKGEMSFPISDKRDISGCRAPLLSV